MLDQTIIDRFNELPESYRSFITGDFVEQAIKTFGTSLDFTESDKLNLKNGLIFRLLFIFDKNDFIEYMTTSTNFSVAEITPVIEVLLKSMPDFTENSIYQQARKEDVSTLSEELNEMEETLKTLHSIRTMDEDMDAAKQEDRVHKSSQDAIFSKQTKLPQHSDTPRWETE